jgi:molecular chaperone GrpE
MSEQPDDLERLDGIEGELGAGPDIVEEFWEGDDTADVIEVDDDELLADTIDTEIHELSNERDQFKDIAQRLQADFDNYRKRTSTHLAAEIDRATGRLAEALLPVLDATEAAYVQHPDEIGPLFNLMLAELRKHGLEPIDLLGKQFDPNLADAVAHEPGDGGEPVVAEVLRSGYLWNGRTLRPAMVRTRD